MIELAMILVSSIFSLSFLWLAVKMNEKAIQEGESIFNIFINPLSVILFTFFVFTIPIPFNQIDVTLRTYNATSYVSNVDLSPMISTTSKALETFQVIQMVLIPFLMLDIILIVLQYAKNQKLSHNSLKRLEDEGGI
jgi:hypothetical protein